jgi:hypothetical protein
VSFAAADHDQVDAALLCDMDDRLIRTEHESLDWSRPSLRTARPVGRWRVDEFRPRSAPRAARLAHGLDRNVLTTCSRVRFAPELARARPRSAIFSLCSVGLHTRSSSSRASLLRRALLCGAASIIGLLTRHHRLTPGVSSSRPRSQAGGERRELRRGERSPAWTTPAAASPGVEQARQEFLSVLRRCENAEETTRAKSAWSAIAKGGAAGRRRRTSTRPGRRGERACRDVEQRLDRTCGRASPSAGRRPAAGRGGHACHDFLRMKCMLANASTCDRK